MNFDLAILLRTGQSRSGELPAFWFRAQLFQLFNHFAAEPIQLAEWKNHRSGEMIDDCFEAQTGSAHSPELFEEPLGRERLLFGDDQRQCRGGADNVSDFIPGNQLHWMARAPVNFD